MTVAELVKALMKMPPEAQVYLEIECNHGNWHGTDKFDVLEYGPKPHVGLTGQVND